MKNKNLKLELLISSYQKYIQMIHRKRLELGESDGPMVSQSPSGRFELEQEIDGLESIVSSLRVEIKKLQK